MNNEYYIDAEKYGVTLRPPCIQLPPAHKCYGCVWYDRNADVLFCPFCSCVRNKKGFETPRKTENDHAY